MARTIEILCFYAVIYAAVIWFALLVIRLRRNAGLPAIRLPARIEQRRNSRRTDDER